MSLEKPLLPAEGANGNTSFSGAEWAVICGPPMANVQVRTKDGPDMASLDAHYSPSCYSKLFPLSDTIYFLPLFLDAPRTWELRSPYPWPPVQILGGHVSGPADRMRGQAPLAGTAFSGAGRPSFGRGQGD